jgi:hypothetical protein
MLEAVVDEVNGSPRRYKAMSKEEEHGDAAKEGHGRRRRHGRNNVLCLYVALDRLQLFVGVQHQASMSYMGG